jgi:hypothetical protein
MDWQWPLLLKPAPGLPLNSSLSASRVILTSFAPESAEAEKVVIRFASPHLAKQNGHEPG